jgi:TrmH family RNA methyltransferase
VITLRKLEGLPPGTRGRKLLSLLAEDHDPDYDAGLVRLAFGLLGEPGAAVADARAKAILRQRLGLHLGLSVADWDLQAPPDRQGEVVRFPFSVWLEDVRSPFNVGSIMRTAEAYGFSAVCHSPSTPGVDHPRTRRTAMGAEALLTVEALSLDRLKARWGGRPVFALELGGVPVARFDFPAEGLVLVGGEELGLSADALAWAEASGGRVSLPLYGRKASLNVGVAFGVLAAAWTGAFPRTSS